MKQFEAVSRNKESMQRKTTWPGILANLRTLFQACKKVKLLTFSFVLFTFLLVFKKIIFTYFYFMCMDVLPAFMSMHHIQARRPEGGVRSPRTGVTHDC